MKENMIMNIASVVSGSVAIAIVLCVTDSVDVFGTFLRKAYT